jgi:hypothetical protein
VGTRNDDISLILAKAKKQGFLPDVSDSEVDILLQEAKNIFGNDSGFGASVNKRRSMALLRNKVAVMATPPTVTSAASSAITGTKISHTDSRFKYAGGIMYPFANPVYRVVKPYNSDNTSTYTNASISFKFEGQIFEWETLSSDGSWRLWVNGQPATALWQNQDNNFFKVDLGSRAVWDIRIQHHRGYFSGVKIQANDNILEADFLSPLRMSLVGDSFGYGQSYASGAAVYTPGYIHRLGELLQIEDLIGTSIGGTGYLNKGPGGTHPTFRERLELDVVPYAPDIVLFQGTINDNGQTTAAVVTEINEIHKYMKTALPNTAVIACSQLQSKATDATAIAMNAAQKAAWETLRVPFVDVLGINTGTGNVGATTGTGTADINCSADATHPSWPAGFDQLASILAPKISSALKSVA